MSDTMTDETTPAQLVELLDRHDLGTVVTVERGTACVEPWSATAARFPESIITVELGPDEPMTEAHVLDVINGGGGPFELVGLSNQQGGGQIMHPSEALSEGMAAEMLAQDGRYAAIGVDVEVVCHKCGEADCYLSEQPEGAGWVLVHLPM